MDNSQAATIDTKVPADIVSLRTQLVSKGHTKRLLAGTDIMSVHIHCYSSHGGENGLHAHTQEDHMFVVLQGEAQFFGVDGALPRVKKHQAIFLPRGCQYSFSNEAEEPLVLLRFGAHNKGENPSMRIDPNGHDILSRAQQKGAAKPVVIENAFFE